MEFVKEIKTKVFDASLFECGRAYMCTHRDPVSDVTHTFFGILHNADTSSLVFVTIDNNRVDVITISIDDAPNWIIEKMIDPMSEEELDFLKELLTKYAIGAFGANDGSDKHITDSIMKKLGFINAEES